MANNSENNKNNSNINSKSSSRLYDLVIFGATGFVGQYAIRDLVSSIADNAATDKRYSNIRWAIAGRRMDKLQQTLADLDEELKTTDLLDTVPIITADVSDLASIEAMAACTTVLLNCVGPYDDFGRPVVEACIQYGTAHLDLAAELQFIEGVQVEYDEAARKAGALIVSAVGFCSTIPEMGLALARRHFTTTAGTLHSVETYIDMKAGKEGFKVNFGTFHSLLYSFVRIGQLLPIRRRLNEQFRAVQLPRSRLSQPQRLLTVFGDSPGLNILFPVPDLSVVGRTAHYNYEHHKERPVRYCAYFRIRPKMLCAWPVGCLWCCSPGRALLKRNIGCLTAGFISSKGPTREQVLGNSFSMRVVAKGWSEVVSSDGEEPKGKRNLKVTMKLSGADPAYVVTAAALVQVGLTVLFERQSMPSGGVLTVGSAFRATRLWDRLQGRGIKVEVLKEEKL